MTAGQTKITMLLELKNKMKAGLDSAKSMVSKDTAEIKEKLNGLKSNHVEAFSSMKDEIPGLGNAIGLLANPYALAAAGVTMLATAFVNAKDKAAEWELGMSKINLTAQLGKSDLQDLSHELNNIAKNNVGPHNQVTEAFNKIISSGLDVNTSLSTIDPVLKAAKASQTDALEVAGAVSATMASSGIKDATHVLDVLFATLNKGNAEFRDVAQYLPKIIPGAVAAGHSLDEVAGSFAFLTAQGLNAESSNTGLMNLFKSLSDGKITNKLQGVGIDVFDAAGKAKPLIEVINELKRSTQFMTDADKTNFFEKIGFDMETTTAISTMMQDTEKFKNILDFTAQSQGQLAAAIDNTKLAGDSWGIAMSGYDSMMENVGKNVNEDWGKMGDELLPLIQTGLTSAEGILSGIWTVFSDVVQYAWAMIKPVTTFTKILWDGLNSSQLLKDTWWLIATAMGKMIDIVQAVSDKISWLYEHTLKPMFEAFNQAYVMAKEMLGFGQKKETVGGNSYLPYGAQQLDMFGQTKTPTTSLANPYGFATANLNALPKAKAPVKAKKEGNGTAISGKAEQVRNITIHINTMGVNGDFISNNADFSKMGKRELQAWFNDMLNRFAHDLETSYG